MFNYTKKLSKEKISFYTFLLVHLIIWTSVALIRKVMPTDSLEGIFWGSLHDFGSPKHPCLAAWLTYLAYTPFKSDFCVYLMSQLFITIGFIYTYQLAKNFIDQNKAMLSVIILEGCYIYSYVTGYYGFNPDVVLLCTLPVITYYFYKCMVENKSSDWIMLGIVVGLSFLGKYQTGLLIVSMTIWASIFNKKTFKNKFFYISIIIAFLIFLPHLLWLIKYDFFPITYYSIGLAQRGLSNHIITPLIFLLMQIVMTIGSIIIYTIYRLKFKENFTFVKEYDKKFWFLILLCFIPLIIHLTMAIISGGNVIPRWGYVFWYLLGIILFYCFPSKIEKEQFSFILKLSYTVMFIIFTFFGTMLTVEKNFRSRYPVSTIWSDFKEIWGEQYKTPLKYVSGDPEWSYPLSIYGDTHPTNIMYTFEYKNPWINENDLKKSGAIIVERYYETVINWTKATCPYLPNDYKITPKEYKFVVHNALGMPRQYTIYYVIVPPMLK